MSAGLYTVAQVARYFGSRPQDVARMIEEDALPVVTLPAAKRAVKKVTLHGLHGWLSARHSGTAFMSVDQLAAEIEAAQSEASSLGLLQLRAAVERVFEAISRELVPEGETKRSQTKRSEEVTA